MLRFSDANAKTANLYSVSGVQPYLRDGRKVYSLDLPSGITCPGARDCHSWAVVDPQTGRATIKDGPHCQFRCFSASQEVLFKGVRALRTHNMGEIEKCGKSAAKIARLILASLPSDAGVIRLLDGVVRV